MQFCGRRCPKLLELTKVVDESREKTANDDVAGNVPTVEEAPEPNDEAEIEV